MAPLQVALLEAPALSRQRRGLKQPSFATHQTCTCRRGAPDGDRKLGGEDGLLRLRARCQNVSVRIYLADDMLYQLGSPRSRADTRIDQPNNVVQNLLQRTSDLGLL